MSAEELIELSGCITFKDILRFQFFHTLRRTWWFLMGILIFLVLFLLLAAVAWFLPDGQKVAAEASRAGVGLLLMWITIIALCPYMSARKQIKTMPALDKPIEYIFSSSRFRIVTEYSSGDTSWRALWMVAEAKTFFALYFNAASALIVPNRLFSDLTQQERWRDLAEAQIQPKKIVRPGVVGKLL